VLLYIYPVAGVHVLLVDVVLVLLSMLILGDGRSYWQEQLNARVTQPVRRILVPVTLCLMLAALGVVLIKARGRYFGLEPLNLPGAAALRLSGDEARGLREVAALAKESCSLLVEVPAMPSFNLWTGLPGPEGLPFANIVTGLDDDAQRSLIQLVSSTPRGCIIYNPEMVAFWTHNADVSARPIIQYMKQDFRPVLESGGNQLMVSR